jgi:hypothetical protein
MNSFDFILDPIYLPMDGLHDAFDTPRNKINVATDGSHLDADKINRFLCFSSGPAKLG